MKSQRTAILLPVTAQTSDASYASLRILRDRWPEVSVAALRSVGAPAFVEADHVFDVADFADPYEPRCLVSEDQITLVKPAVLKAVMGEYETVVWCGAGVLPVAPMEQPMRQPVTVAALANVHQAHSLTPLLTPLGVERSSEPESLLMVFQHGAESFLERWQALCRQSVVDVDQRSVTEHSNRFIAHAANTNQLEVDGSRLLMSWIDYGSIQSDRAEGVVTPFVLAHELIAMERELQALDDRPEVELQMLLHRVHDSRPYQFLRDAISARPLESGSQDAQLNRFVADTRRAADPFGHRWRGEGSEVSFRDWLCEENQFGITRAAELIIRQNGLWWRFPKARYDPSPFYRYLDEGGVEEIGFDPRTLESFDSDADEASSSELERHGQRANPFLWRWNIVKQLVPGAQARMNRGSPESFLGVDPRFTRGVAAPTRIPIDKEPSMWGSAPRSLSLIGCFRSESGLGQAARASLQALELLDRTFTHVDTSEKYPSRNSAEVDLGWSTFGNVGDVNLIHSNADEMITMSGGAFRYRFGGRFNAAMWFWETADLPERSQPAFDIVDELWVASEYLVDVFGQYEQVPVYNVGLAADLPEYRQIDRSALGFHDDEFVFLFVYDALSSYGRKNPGKALEAFVNAFGPKFEGVRFVLKVSNLNKFPASQAEILRLERKYRAITVIDEYLTRAGVLDLMAAADVYVSLHAAEGYGLTILESMALGTPSICTGYSGNMDFTTNENSWLVDYDIVATEDQTGPYPAGSVWASPNIESATELMRRAAHNRTEVELKAMNARHDALQAASLESYAKRLEAQLRRVGV